MKVFFVTTEHLEDSLWFRDIEDFKAGMNLVALLATSMPISVLAFILMSNHVHFVLICSYEEAQQFINLIKQYHSRFLWKKYGMQETLQGIRVDIQEIEFSDECVERVIAYTQMNSVAANICTYPTDYPWGSGSCFFRVKPVRGTPIGQLSGREQTRLLHTRKKVPKHLLLGDDGYILPESYVNVRFVEGLFQTPKRMLHFLQNSSKAKKRLARSEEGLPAFRDQVLVAAIPDLCQSLFQCRSVNVLKEPQLAELFRQLRFRFSADVTQIARAAGFPYEKVTRLLEDFQA